MNTQRASRARRGDTLAPTASTECDMAPREGRLVAVVPVRAGSLRCAFKNSRPFAFSTLLQRKLETLRQVEGIDEMPWPNGAV